MGTQQVLIFVTLVSSCLCLREVIMTSSFRRLGSVATGLNYAHLHGSIDFRGLQQAHLSVLRTMEERLREGTSKEERTLMEALWPQLDIATTTLDDLQVFFFGRSNTRPKRQLFLGLAVALGLVSTGTSIYTTTEIVKLHAELSSMKSDFQHVAHMLDQEAQAVNRLAANMATVSKTCHLVLGRLLQEEDRVNMLMGMLGMMSLISGFNAELSARGRGLEALANGKLHPALPNHGKLRHAISAIDGKAKAIGRRILHDDENAVFRAPVSYLATEEGRIISSFTFLWSIKNLWNFSISASPSEDWKHLSGGDSD